MSEKVFQRAQKLNESDIIEAIRKDGYEKVANTYIVWENRKVVAACAFGQAALNLAPKSWTNAEKEDFASDIHSRALNLNYLAFSQVIDLNDHTDKTLPEIADEVENLINAKV